MPKSRKRKDHNKRVEKRNDRVKTEYERAAKAAWETFEKMKAEKLAQQAPPQDNGFNFDFK